MNGRRSKQLRRLAEESTIGKQERSYVDVPRPPSIRLIRQRIASLGAKKWSDEMVKIIEAKTFQRVLDPECTRYLYQHLKTVL